MKQFPAIFSLPDSLHALLAGETVAPVSQKALDEAILAADVGMLSEPVLTPGPANGWTGWTVLALHQWRVNGASPNQKMGLLNRWQDRYAPLTRVDLEETWDHPVLIDGKRVITAHGLWALMAQEHADRVVTAHQTAGGRRPSPWFSEVFRQSFPVASDLETMLSTAHTLMASSLHPRPLRQALAKQLLGLLHSSVMVRDESEEVKQSWVAFRDQFIRLPAAVQIHHFDQWVRLVHPRGDHPLPLPMITSDGDRSRWNKEWSNLLARVHGEAVKITPTQVKRQLHILETKLSKDVRRAKLHGWNVEVPQRAATLNVLKSLHAQSPDLVDVPHWIATHKALPDGAGNNVLGVLNEWNSEVMAKERQANTSPLTTPVVSRARVRV